MNGREKRRPIWWWPAVVIGGAVALAVVLALVRTGAAPEVEIEPERAGIGRRTPVVVRASEPGRGLSRLEVHLVQDGNEVLLAERDYRPRPFWAFWGPATESDELAIEVGKETVAELVEGEAEIRVTAARASTLLRRPEPAVTTLALPVRLTPPLISVTTPEVRIAQGGSEVVVYRVGPTAVTDGVRAGEWWFPGYPLPGGSDGERFSLFSAPWDLDDASAIQLVAADEVGNQATREIVLTYKRRPPSDAVINLSDDFFAQVVPEILAATPGIADQGDPLANYLKINGELRQKNAEELIELARKSRPEFLWRGPFKQLSGSQVMSTFADRRSYRYDGREVDRQVHLGFDLASVRRAPVAAANRGLVVKADYFGIYGNTVILDHGYGLMTLYAHLSSLSVGEGEMVEKGQEVGRTGETGLAAGDHLHFTILLQGLAVHPIEWWDGKWIRDHLGEKLGPALPGEGDAESGADETS